MRLLIVVPPQDRATGNWVTAGRLQQGLAARGHAVTLADAVPGSLRAALAVATPELVLLLHAWRSGQPWLETGSPLPYVVLLTGTDVNLGRRDPLQAPVIATVLQQSAAVLSQNPLTLADLRRDCPHLVGKIHYLPPGIVLGTAPCPLREQLAASPRELVLLCPAALRPVKGVLELPALCAPLLDEGRPLRLALCGPVLDAAYGERLFAELALRPWATWLGCLPPAAIPAAMRQADVILSNSLSEGLPNALVEAAVLGRPIVCSDIPGHRAVVSHGGNGLLYADGDGFRTAIRRLLDEPGLLQALSHPAPQHFAPEREAAVLEEVCLAVLKAAPGAGIR